MIEENKVHLMNCIEGLRRLPAKCANLIICDPPYYRVKGDFDFKMTWKEWLNLHRNLARECRRVIADNGSLFVFGDRRNIAYQQIIFDKFFTFENHIFWQKSSKSMVERFKSLRSFPERGFERILFYSTDMEPGELDKTGWEKVMEEKIKPRHPFANYLRSEFERAGVSRKEIAALFPSKTGGLTGCVSNWLNGDNVITEDQYLIIRDYLNGEYLRKEYEELRKEYEELRRPFNNYLGLCDHWFFTNGNNREIDHDTPKPEKMTRAIILTCSRKNDLVLVPFAGSGTECAMAAKEGRRFIGFEIEQKYVDMSNERAQQHLERKQISILDFVE